MAEAPEFRVADWLVQPSLNRVSQGDERRTLPKRLMDLLVFLADNQGRVASKEEITRAVWHKEYVSEGTLSHAVAVIRQTLGDDTRLPRFIETIPTRGYRMIAPVTPVEDLERAKVLPERAALRRWRAAAAALGLVVVAAAVFASLQLLASRGAPLMEPGGRLAVLPFENLGAANRTYLAAGLTDDLTTRLAGVPGLSVISRLSALSSARSGRSARQISQELGADYLLVGTTRWERTEDDEDRIWVNAQLVRTADDTHLWGGSYNQPLANVFEIEADIAGQVVEKLGVVVAEPQRRRLEDQPTGDVGAYQAYLCGVGYSHFETRDQLGLAQAMFERATELDPGFARAWAELGVVHTNFYRLQLDHTEARLLRGRDAVSRALVLAPDLAEGHRAMGAYLLLGQRDYEKALTEFNEAARALPNDSELRALMADLHRRQGRWDEARSELEAAHALDSRNYVVALALGDTLSSLRRYGAADIAYRQAMSAMPDAAHPYLRRFWNMLRWEGPGQRAADALAQLPQPDQPPAVYSRFYLHFSRREFDAALQVVSDADRDEIPTLTMIVPATLLECLCLKRLGRSDEATLRCGEALAMLAGPAAEDASDPGVILARGYAESLLGQREAAVRDADRAIALCPIASDAVDGTAFLADAARIFALAGDVQRSAQTVSILLSLPSHSSMASVSADPCFDSVRADPRFVAALARSANPAGVL